MHRHISPHIFIALASLLLIFCSPFGILGAPYNQQQQCFNVTGNYEPFGTSDRFTNTCWCSHVSSQLSFMEICLTHLNAVYDIGFECSYYSPVTCCSSDLSYVLGRGSSALELKLNEFKRDMGFLPPTVWMFKISIYTDLALSNDQSISAINPQPISYWYRGARTH